MTRRTLILTVALWIFSASFALPQTKHTGPTNTTVYTYNNKPPSGQTTTFVIGWRYIIATSTSWRAIGANCFEQVAVTKVFKFNFATLALELFATFTNVIQTRC